MQLNNKHTHIYMCTHDTTRLISINPASLIAFNQTLDSLDGQLSLVPTEVTLTICIQSLFIAFDSWSQRSLYTLCGIYDLIWCWLKCVSWKFAYRCCNVKKHIIMCVCMLNTNTLWYMCDSEQCTLFSCSKWTKDTDGLWGIQSVAVKPR